MIVAHFKNVYKYKSAKFIKQLNHISFLGMFLKVSLMTFQKWRQKKNKKTVTLEFWGKKNIKK